LRLTTNTTKKNRMAEVEMLMPKMGESIIEATILSWLKKEGDAIDADESLLEVATDKVDTEVPSTHGGIIKKILAAEGDVVPVGSPVALIATEQSVEAAASQPVAPPAMETNGTHVVETAAVASSPAPEGTFNNGSNGSNGKISSDRFYSPLVLNIARQEAIPMVELETMSGTGKEGRVTKKDILSFVKTRTIAPVVESTPAATPIAASSPTLAAAPAIISGENEIIEMDRMRKMIAERMVESKKTSAHVTSFVEADMTNIVKWRNKVKDEFQKREGEKLTFTPIIIEAVVQAIKDFPMINISVDGANIIKKRDVNIGMAVALPSGNLIVPVIKNADQLNLVGITKKVNELSIKARNNKLTPDDLSGGTYTVSNVGSFGNVMGTPIIMQPQVAIMALGAIQKKPAVIETSEGDFIGIRHKMFLSHSYDHRVVDGALGGMMVRRVADYLEKFDTNRTI